MPRSLTALILALVVSTTARHVSAELFLPSIFGDSMVVQRDQPVHVWGWTQPGQKVTAQLGDRSGKSVAGEDGRFDLKIQSLPAGGPYDLVINADEQKIFTDVLVGEVWVCSGQSNMAWQVSNANDADLEALSSNYPEIRLISVPQVGTQEPQRDFEGKWAAANPTTVKDFSAVGFFFGRRLHQILDVPVGLIDNAWGGSAAEAWVPKDVLADDGKYDELLASWEKKMANYDFESILVTWQTKYKKWAADGRKGNPPRKPRDDSAGNHRPANIYNGVLLPTIGYTIRGAIWYQGESNSSRAYQYRDLFPLMIQTWRDQWGQGDFPFYWVQLADFRNENTQPEDSDWAELREAQTMTISRLKNTGQAVIVDVGEGRDIHPRNKQIVANRLARWALAKDYGIEIPFQSPTFESMEIKERRAVLTFSHVGQGLYTFDVPQAIGFTVAGEDQKFYNATAQLVGKDKIVVSAPEVSNPVSVRYAWANNPICNVQSRDGLPLTPFRTDQWKGVTEGVVSR